MEIDFSVGYMHVDNLSNAHAARKDGRLLGDEERGCPGRALAGNCPVGHGLHAEI